MAFARTLLPVWALCWVALAPTAFAQTGSSDDEVEEILVTGSHLRTLRDDTPNPVTTVSRDSLLQRGNPDIVHVIKTLGVSSGTDGDTNQFQSAFLEGTSNVNLRGLGPARTLTLFNGKRLPYAGRSVQEAAYQAFVNVNNIPIAAVNRVEVLRDGSSSIYGSDAVAGVVNFVTRDALQGLEVSSGFQSVTGGEPWSDLSLAWGIDAGDRGHLLLATSRTTRGELNNRERNWSIRPYSENERGGWSGTGNPSAFDISVDISGTTLSGDDFNPRLVDPDCANFGGVLTMTEANPDLPDNCLFQFTPYGNLVEEEARSQTYSEFDLYFPDGSHLELSTMLTEVEVPSYATSPSLPPSSSPLDNVVPVDHPGLRQLIEDVAAGNNYNSLCPISVTVPGHSHAAIWLPSGGDDCSSVDPNAPGTGFALTDVSNLAVVFTRAADGTISTPAAPDLLFRGRYLGSGATQPGRGQRNYKQDFFSMDYDFKLARGAIDGGVSAYMGEVKTRIAGEDMLTQRLIWALKGVGGPDCGTADTDRLDASGDPASGFTAGTGDCLYYNPFSNALSSVLSTFAPNGAPYAQTANPNYDADLANSSELLDWLTEPVVSRYTNSLQVLEANFSGGFLELPGGIAQWAFGMQLRQEGYQGTFDNFYNRDAYPCRNPIYTDTSDATNCPESQQVSVFGFMTAQHNFDLDEQVLSLFSEVTVPFTSGLFLQASMRYEDYDSVGDSLDPGVSVRLDIAAGLTARASWGTSYKAPQLSQISLRNFTGFSFVRDVTTFKAIDTTTTPSGLESETSENMNFGLVYDNGPLSLTVDAWSLQLDNPIITEDYNAILAEYCPRPNPDAIRMCDPSLEGFDSRLTFAEGTDTSSSFALTAANLDRISVFVINGEQLQASGIDFALRWHSGGAHPLAITLDLSQNTEYNLNGVDYLGKLNESQNAVRPVPESKIRLSAFWGFGDWTFYGAWSQISEYMTDDDDIPSVAAWSTIDLNIGWRFAKEGSLYASIDNLADEAPPAAPVSLNYDSYSHNPLGRTIKVGVNYNLR